MRIKTLAATALVTLAGTFGTATVAEAGSKAPTKVTIKGDNGDYYGYVKAKTNPDCAVERTVHVYKMNGSSPQPKEDQKIGSDTSDATPGKSSWSIGNSGYKTGHFYAKVKKTEHCKGATSKVIVR